jgi:xylan 1,4-beta-xylosidase
MRTLLCLLLLAAPAMAHPAERNIAIDARAPGRPLPHFWEQMFGSGRAILSLRESYRRDLRDTVRATGATYVRFHGIFHDEVGVYDEDAQGRSLYNFSYVDQIYDGLLEAGVRPFVELSFMPRKLAERQSVHEFWYGPIVAPPKSWERYDALVTALAEHLIERYGLDEVSRWYFEVWNEPNIQFWSGEPKEATYYELYDHTARALKRVSTRLRVGGPASAQAAWVDRFIRHAVETGVPIDFVSTHVYANDTARDVFGTDEQIGRREMVCRAARKVHDQVKASARPELPIIWSEFNASYKNEPEITDSLMMGPWLADTIRRCDGLTQVMAYWTFSDVFEEQGVVKEPFYGGFGLIAAGGLHKPAFNAFALLHHLGEERLPVAADDALVTRRRDGTLVIALWNLVLPGEHGATRRVTLRVRNLAADGRARLWRVDAEHGSLLASYQAMGKPRYPSAAQAARLRKAAQLSPEETRPLLGGALTVDLPINGLLLIELPPTHP